MAESSITKLSQILNGLYTDTVPPILGAGNGRERIFWLSRRRKT